MLHQSAAVHRQPRRPVSPSKANTLFTELAQGAWSGHDLCKVACTAWIDLGVDYMVGELLLNHALKDLNATYIHTTAEALKCRALEVWQLDQHGFAALHARDIGETGNPTTARRRQCRRGL